MSSLYLRRTLDDFRPCIEPCPQHFASHVTGRDASAGGVSQPLDLAGVTSGEHKVFSVHHRKPHGCFDGDAALPEGGQVYVSSLFQRCHHWAIGSNSPMVQGSRK